MSSLALPANDGLRSLEVAPFRALLMLALALLGAAALRVSLVLHFRS